MSDHELPDLPSDEELGIAGLEGELERPPPEPERRGRRPPEKPPRAPARGRGTERLRPWLGPLTLVVLLALAYTTAASRALPRARPASAPDTAFSSGRAMLDVVALAARPRPPGSPGHESAREHLLARLRELGLSPEVQTTTWVRRSGAVATAVTVRNVTARLPGSASTGAVLLTAHYDSRGISRGAGDDATGVAVVLETARALRSGPPLANDVVVLLTDAEELGLAGARAFAERHAWMEDVAVVLSVEMRGGGGPSVMFETGAENGWIARALAEGAPGAYGFSLGTEVYRRMPNDTDFTVFREAGVQGLNFAAIGKAHVYHQAWDEPARLDVRTLQHHGEQVLGVARALGGRDLTDVDASDATFFPLPFLGLVVYPVAVSYALALALVVVAALGGLTLRRAPPPRLLGVAAGLGLGAVVIGGTAGAARLAFPWLAGRHPEHGFLEGSAFHAEGWYVAAMAALALALATGLLALARPRLGLAALSSGALLIPLAGALVLGFVAPAGAANLQWPVLFALAGSALLGATDRGAGRPALWLWLPLAALAAATLAFMTPLAQLVWLSFGMDAAPLVAAIVGLSVLLLLPLLEWLREPGGWWAPLLASLAAGALVGAGLLHAAPTSERPRPSTLLWALDRDATAAVWATRPDGAEAWASGRAGSPLAAERSLADWMVGGAPYLTGPAPTFDVPEPSVTASPLDTAAAGRRTVRLTLRSAVDAEVLGVRLPAGPDVLLRSVNGVPVPGVAPADRVGGERVRELRHYGRPEGDVVLELEVGGSADSVSIEVVEHHLRPQALLGERWFLRPPDMAPNVAADSDRALMRGTFEVPLGPFPEDPAAAGPG